MGKDTFTLAGREWPKVNWWKMKGMRSVYLTLGAAMVTSATNGYDGSLMNGLEALDDWKRSYNHPEGATLGLLAASMSIGSILAIPVVPYVADLFGRRLIGACVALGTNNIKGNDWSWRVPCLLQGVPSVCQLIFIWFVPESPRWLISKGKSEKAKKILAYVHAQGDEDDELVNVEFDEIQQTIALEKQLEGSGWSELWSTPGNRHRSIILISIGFFSQWSGNGIVSYFLPKVLELIGITDSHKVLTINSVLNAVNVVSATGICFFVDKLGRRKLFLTSVTCMLLCFISTTIALARFPHGPGGADDHAGNAVIVFIFLYYISYNIGFSGLLVSYSSEILPYRLRAKGLTLMFFCVALSLLFNQYVNPIALLDIGWKYYIVYCVWLLFELFVVWKYYVETKNTPLEEIVKFFDGDQAVLGGAAATEKIHELVTVQARSAEETLGEKGPAVLAAIFIIKSVMPSIGGRTLNSE
ncbi:hypothetical protein AN8347.2 [Aspergillus nidulans FGSC A4]|uniref:Major facilitator superfamily (MFS) profile domain-containing protein n=1 Tax=Emericella nidulans (strain FGSC A4 / ATCC 38163 / CBS 112.46 / NRRL 194 / M139) TaxID=227321 RepID=Q5ATN3_EMENI|nr:hypothetical protein [Aspergillus nidulans FGSC A4]EAA66909.1 hypothetical protein AN8347.2 [Aspergillus nidulans FGSC A4]CBF80355.1 TPA: conserved hypothetical protein [Aspergillus nidulans FGSC A4]|eukprot:XP_681616.1 hypothetical protein AN8347.2 [Aspergillus nidulans FGSC A4]